MIVPQSAQCYRSDDGSVLIINGREVLFAPDGENFYELQGGSGLYAGSYMDAKFVDKRDGTEYEIEHNATRVNGTLYKPVATPAEINFVTLPEVRRPEYMFLAADGTVIYVSADLHHFSYESFRFFIGTLEELREVRIVRVDRARDGGTTYIYTEEGALFSPTPFKKDGVPTWAPNGDERITLKRVKNPEAFEITENKDGACVACPDVAFVAE